MAISFMVKPPTLHAQDIQINGYIQNHTNNSMEIVTNNFFGGEIYSNQEENNQNILSYSPQALASITDKNFFLKNKSHLNGCFIHNLSTNKQKVQQIRAP